MPSKTLAFVYHTPFWYENGKVVTSHAAVGKYVESLAPYFAKIILAVPAPGPGQTAQHTLLSENLQIDQLPHYHNIPGYWLRLPKYLWKLILSAKTWDILNIRVPTHLGFLAYLAAKLRKIPVFLVVVGEFYTYNSMSSYPAMKQRIVNLDSVFHDYLMAKMIRACFVFTNGDELFHKYSPLSSRVFLMRSSTINDNDIVKYLGDKKLHDPIRILTVATVSPRKGIRLIPEIISILRLKGYQLEWKYIGKVEGSSGERELQRTLTIASQLSVAEYLRFCEQRPWDALKIDYCNSDIFVLPTYAEGVPRVLLEAQASGLPIVTTKVGGIPKAIRDGYDGLLANLGDPESIANAIERLIMNKSLYQSIAQNGLETAKEHTLESETRRMVRKVLAEI